jgi:outer membrane receptor protein involved in Fe transport
LPAYNIYSPPVFRILPEGQYALAKHSEYTYGAELEFKLKLLRNNNLMVGLQADVHGVKNASALTNYYPEAIPIPIPYSYNADSTEVSYRNKDQLVEISEWIQNGGHRYQNIAIYWQDIHYFTDNLGITFGARFDLDSEIGSIINPRLGMVWDALPYLSFKALYGEAYRAPTTSEQYKVFGYDHGNEDLNYEEIQTTEFVLTFKNKMLISQFSYYFNKMNNIIQPQTDSLGIISYFNTGKNESQGFEIENKVIFSKSFQMFFNYDYKTSYDIIEGKEIDHPNITNHIAIVGLSHKLTKKLSYSAYTIYYGPTKKYLNTYPLLNKEYVSEDKVGDFFLLNSSLHLSDIIKNIDIYLYGYNLLNQKYFFQDDLTDHQPAQPKIHFLLKVNYNFN